MKPANLASFCAAARRRTLLAATAGAICLAGPLDAQQQQQSAEPAGTAEKESDTVQLSPFEVNTGRDVGFAASSSLAGGRLATDLKDTPVSYSVINRELIDALSLTDLTSAAEWTTNTFKFPDGAGGGDTFNLTVPISVRGVGGVSGLRQRNFFIYYGPMDSYSTERYDFGRGPNQVLFGNGTVGGSQVTMTKRARFDRPRSSIELNVGSWESMRALLDVNQPINDRAAVRFSGVLADRDGWRRNEMEKTEAAFLTTTIKLTQNTELRVEGEAGQQQRRIPYAILTDRLGGWNGSYSGGYLATAQFSALPNGALGINRNGGNYFVYNPDSGPTDTVYGLTDWVITRGAGDTTTTYAGEYLQVGSTSWNQANASILHANNVVSGRFDRALANSGFFIPDESFTNAPKAPNLESDFSDVQLTLSHRVGENLFLELAGDVNQVENDMNRIEANAVNTYLDINPLLPGGATNPNYLRPYGDGQYAFSNQTTSAKSLRAAAAYLLDLDRWGHYSFNLMGGMTNHLVERRNRVLASGVRDGQLVDPRQWATDGNALRQRFYWGDEGNYLPPSGPITYVNNLGVSSTITPTWVPWAGGNDSTNNISDSDANYNYILGAANAKFFDGRLVLLGAMRFDDSSLQVRYLKRIGDFPRDWDMQTLYWRPDAPADWISLPATRPRATNSTSNGIQESTAPAGARYGDDYNPPELVAREWKPSTGAVVHVTSWLSVFGNYAEAMSFNTAAAPDVNGALLPAIQGKGWDAGFRLSLFKDRVTLNASTYSNEEFGNYIDPTSVTNQINTLYQANVLGDTTVGGRNQRNAGDINGLVRDTRTRITEGYELELVANLTRHWRFTANLGLPDNTEREYAPMTRAYVAANESLFRQILEDAGGTVGSDGIAVRRNGVVDTGSGGNEAQGNEAQRAVNAFNTLYSNLRNFVVNSRKSLTAPDNANLFTDYTFSQTALKGLKLGFGINWRGERVVGYRGGDTIVNPANPTQAIDNPAVDGYTPVWAPGAALYTATVGYTWKLKDRRELSLNLRISNLFDENDVIWTDTTTTLRPLNGDFTSPARETVLAPYAYQTPRSFTFTARFSF